MPPIEPWLPTIEAIGAAVAVSLLLYLLYGAEREDSEAPHYLHEPPASWRPCEVGFLCNWGELSAQDMTAMVMDLVRRGKLRLVASDEPGVEVARSLWQAGGQDQRLEADLTDEAGITPAERYLIEEVLLEGVPSGHTTMREFAARMAADTRGALARYLHWKRLAEAESERLPVVDRASVFARAAVALLGILMVIPVPIYLIAQTRSCIPALGIPVGSLLLAMSGRLRRRLPRAARAYDEWQAFRRYLTDFSQLRSDPAPAITVWDEYLVYAVSLGVAHRVLEQFQALAPAAVDMGGAWMAGVPHWLDESGSWTDALWDAWRALFSAQGSGAKIVRRSDRQ